MKNYFTFYISHSTMWFCEITLLQWLKSAILQKLGGKRSKSATSSLLSLSSNNVNASTKKSKKSKRNQTVDNTSMIMRFGNKWRITRRYFNILQPNHHQRKEIQLDPPANQRILVRHHVQCLPWQTSVLINSWHDISQPHDQKRMNWARYCNYELIIVHVYNEYWCLLSLMSISIKRINFSSKVLINSSQTRRIRKKE